MEKEVKKRCTAMHERTRAETRNKTDAKQKAVEKWAKKDVGKR